jgi:hypothetical protein
LEESATHLFLNCEVTSNVWRKVFTLFVIDFLTPPDLFVHLDCWTREVNSKKLRKGICLYLTRRDLSDLEGEKMIDSPAVCSGSSVL